MRCSRLLFPVMLLVFAVGCTTMKTSDTSRTAKEQMLVSNSIDQALQKIDFSPFAGQSVFLQDKYVDCIDKNYLVASIRHRAFSSGVRLVDKPENADVILEARSGSVGTDNADMFIGVPEINLPAPVPIALPEVRLLARKNQTATAKIGLVAYDAKSMEPLGSGGVSLAQSDDNNWFVLGLGPYQNGSVRQEVARSIKVGEKKNEIPTRVAFDNSRRSSGNAGIRLTSEIEDGTDFPRRR